MSIKRTVLFSILCMAVTVSYAFAQGGASDKKTCPPYDDPNKTYDPSPIPASIDTNKDGKMTKEEWLAAGAPIASFQMFTERSKNDYVTVEEFLKETPPNGVDLDCDGKITIEEFHTFGLQGPPGGAPGGDAPQGGAPIGAPAGGAPAQK